MTRNSLTDRIRANCQHVLLRDDLPSPANSGCVPEEDLSQFLPCALAELLEADRFALTLWDIEDQSQILAERMGISLPGANTVDTFADQQGRAPTSGLPHSVSPPATRP